MTATTEIPTAPWPQLATASIASAAIGGALVVTALMPVGAGWAQAALSWLLSAVVVVCGLWVAVIDAKEHRLPNAIVLPLYAAVGILLVAQAIATEDVGRFLTAVTAGAIAFLVFLALGLGGGVGFGDVKLAGALALYLGSLSWSTPIIAFVLAFVLAAPHTITLLILHRRSALTHRLPFGPYLVAGTIVAALWNVLAGMIAS